MNRTRKPNELPKDINEVPVIMFEPGRKDIFLKALDDFCVRWHPRLLTDEYATNLGKVIGAIIDYHGSYCEATARAEAMLWYAYGLYPWRSGRGCFFVSDSYGLTRKELIALADECFERLEWDEDAAGYYVDRDANEWYTTRYGYLRDFLDGAAEAKDKEND